ncbi:MAG TPA: MJ1477/TM1410 family putative glycoside hydrolase [Dehalococcoidia bacterium]|nr:MJ1477/TM1410 family putative glycoside hydrolase [Dehalococcoidia bacterium]
MRATNFAIAAALTALALVAVGCSSDGDDDAAQQTPVPEAPFISAPRVQSWAYQLQGEDGADLDLAPLIASDFDLFVIDYSRDGSDEGRFTSAEISALRDGGSGGRTVLAYLSIGEAESYRSYWDPAWESEPPPWLGPTNPEWEGNYKVRYWDPAWLNIVLEYRDDIREAGFDGVYLDIIDAFEFFGPDGEMFEQENAASEMLSLVARIAGSRRQPGLLVFVQNGSAILDVPGFDVASYVRTVDGIGLEDTFYFGDADENNPLDIQSEVTDVMAAFTYNGKLVLAVDYVTDEAKIADFCTRARDEDFVPLTTVRALDRVPEPCP